MRYANRLRVLRADARISQLDLALEAGVAHHRYWRIENGYSEATKAEKSAIAKALKVQPSDAFPEAVAS